MVHAAGQQQDHGKQGLFIKPFPDIKINGQQIGADHQKPQKKDAMV